MAPYSGYPALTPWICARRVFPLRGMTAIDGKVVERTFGIPARARESSSCSVSFAKGRLLESWTSPPSNERDCSRTERVTLRANESIDTSAATPTAIVDMYRNSFRRVVRLSRHASCASCIGEALNLRAPSIQYPRSLLHLPV